MSTQLSEQQIIFPTKDSAAYKALGRGKTYSQLSAESPADPGNTKLASTVDMFKGTMLRGTLLDAYAFWQIALIAGIVTLCTAFMMLVLTLLGFWHLRRTSPEAELQV